MRGGMGSGFFKDLYVSETGHRYFIHKLELCLILITSGIIIGFVDT